MARPMRVGPGAPRRGGELTVPRTSVAGVPGDMAKWLALASALAGLGILPKGWQKALSAAGAAIVIVKLFE